ncbi:MAG TPA: hypothetical protein VIS78_04665, partial [Blastocatellia bacterium]
MTTSNLDRVIEEVKALTPDEQRRLRVLLDDLLGRPMPEPTEEEVQQRLYEKGIIGEIPPPITDLTPYRNRKLMDVKGKPLSETVIEE